MHMSGAVVTASLLREPPPRRHDEERLQRSIVQYARWALPQNAMLIAIPNGGKRHDKAAARLVGMGVTAGAPDLQLWFRGQTLGIEVKLPGTYLSPSQRQMHARMERCGINCIVVRSLDEFVAHMRAFGVPLMARLQ